MAEPIPDSLRQADITRFINRANQLRQYKPVITYWCEYWVVNQILAKGLHNVDDESLSYTTNLMDRLEQTKTENAQEEAITDDAVGQAYVEQFAQDAFERAEKVMNANRVTRQTADTYDAAATFLLLGNIWGPIDEETQKKVKYAKWNAARILKAIKEGKDPNESNPKREEPEEDLPVLDPNDPDVRGLTSPLPKPASVEDDPETEFYKKAPTPAESLPPAASSEPAPTQSSVLDLPSVPTANDLNPPAPQNQGYFDPPEQFPPSPLSQTGANDTAASANAPTVALRRILDGPIFQPGECCLTVAAASNTPSNVTKTPPPPAPKQFKPPPIAPQPKAPVVPASHNSWAPSSAPSDEMDLPKAQKHAKWAISALNFEDVPTAVKELRNALAALGAQ
ncbi:LOW QUALITY PROTEIN: vacuolar protein sorting-associated protein vta1 like protein [Colletotrichum tofieldiae]|nr:LOW QUALITY PROTEIN: vacuolar protein sorting-associated protein vta1 like protein [Colletotrichum tofieldiae]